MTRPTTGAASTRPAPASRRRPLLRRACVPSPPPAPLPLRPRAQLATAMSSPASRRRPQTSVLRPTSPDPAAPVSLAAVEHELRQQPAANATTLAPICSPKHPLHRTPPPPLRSPIPVASSAKPTSDQSSSSPAAQAQPRDPRPSDPSSSSSSSRRPLLVSGHLPQPPDHAADPHHEHEHEPRTRCLQHLPFPPLTPPTSQPRQLEHHLLAADFVAARVRSAELLCSAPSKFTASPPDLPDQVPVTSRPRPAPPFMTAELRDSAPR